MSRTFYVATAAAVFATVAAFAQTSTDKPAATQYSSASAPAASDSAAPTDGKMMHHHHHHHGMRSAKNADSTDFDADNLNACMSNATPTAQQESCLRQASNS